MDAGTFGTIALALGALYCATAAGRFSKFFGVKVKVIKALQGLSCSCEDGVITGMDFSSHRLVELAGEEMCRIGHLPQGKKTLAMHADIVRMQDAIHAYLTDGEDPGAVSSCAAAAEALQSWFQVAYSLKPDWGRVLVPYRAKPK